MSIINDALKKTQMAFKRPKKKEKEKIQDSPKPKDDGIINVYEKMYKDREEKEKTSSAHGVPGKKSPKDKKAPHKSREWLKTIFAAAFLIASISFSFKFLSGYEPLQDFIRSKTGKRRSSRFHIAKHIPKKRVYKAGDLVLNGISFIDGIKVALINDEIYQIGDVVNSKKITSINRDTVELRDNEKIFTIKVH